MYEHGGPLDAAMAAAAPRIAAPCALVRRGSARQCVFEHADRLATRLRFDSLECPVNNPLRHRSFPSLENLVHQLGHRCGTVDGIRDQFPANSRTFSGHGQPSFLAP